MKRIWLTVIYPIIFALIFLVVLFGFAGKTRTVVNAAPSETTTSPGITAIQPDSAPNDEVTPIVIQGSDFSATITGTQVLTVPRVYLGEQELVEVTWGNTTTLSATVPWKLPAQVYPLTVINPDGISATLQNAFTVIDNLPTLDSIEPNTAPNDIDTQIIIRGDKIGAVISGTQVITPPTVYLGNEQLPITWVDATNLEGAVPWGLPADIYTLTVVNPNGISATLQNAFTVTHALGEFHTGGPYGGVAVTLQLKPGDPSTVYALMFGAGLFISEDAAESWTPIHNHNWPIQLDFDAGDPNILYFGADSNDLYRSDDNGTNWVRISGNFHTQNGCFKAYPVAHPVDTGKVYFGMGSCGDMYLEPDEGGIYFSNNFGALWSPRNNGLADRDIQALAINPSTPNTLIAGSLDGDMFYSTNGGDNWVWSTQLTGTVSSLYFNPHETLEAWAITRSDAESRAYLYRSVNLMDWIPINLSLTDHGGPSMAQMDFRSDSVWLAATNVYTSTDSGDTWNAVNRPTWGAAALAVSPDDPQTIFVGTDFGVEKSTDGSSTWEEANEGLAALVPNAVAVSSINLDTLYIKTHQGIFASKNGGYDWQYLDYGISGFNGHQSLAIDPFDDAKLFFNAGCEDEFCIEISMDAGTTWNWITSSLPPAYAGWSCNSFTILPSPHTLNRVLVGASLSPPGGGDVESIFYTSSNGGANWSYVLPPQTIARVTELVYDSINPNLVYAATAGSGLWRSTDGGNSWESVSVDNETSISVSAIAVHPNVTNKIYVRTYNYFDGPNPEPELWVSEDAGASWLPMSYVFLGIDLLISPPVPDQFLYTLYTGCELGLCRSFEDGLAWDSIAGMPRPEILNGASDGERSVIYLGTSGGLVYSVGTQATLNADLVPGRGNLGGGGVYRLVTTLPDEWLYLPLTIR